MQRLVCVLVVAVALLTMCPAPALAQVSGAIFTTNPTGTVINGNIYTLQTDVYLNGGPAHPGAAGLPDGYYAARITEPNGMLLGTTVGSGNNTPIHVTNGNFDQLYELWAIMIKASDGTMGYDTTSNAGGEYKVWVCSSTLFDNNLSKTDNFKIKENPSWVAIMGTKFYDANANGTWDAGEPVIAGWKITKYPPDPAAETYTSISGRYSFLAPPNSGQYTITEVLANTMWHNTTPLSGIVTVLGVDVAGPNFGNVCLGAGGGLTLGFWSNKNGQALVGSDDLLMLSNLPLVDGTGAAFDPATYTQLHDWLLNGNAVNMAYMLSVQLAAMELNVYNGKVSGTAMVYAPGVPGANAYGFVSVNSLMAAAVAELSLAGHEIAFGGYAWRPLQETIKNALDAANNNYTFVQPTPCAFTTPY